MKKIIALSLAALASMPTMAQNDHGDLTIDAQIRARGEYRNGQGQLRESGVNPAAFINERARIGLGWDHKALSLKVSGQHTGVWGDSPQTNKTGDFSLNEAWAKLKFGTNDRFFAQLGRQILSYDDERLLGGLDWATTGRSHDALRLGYSDGTHTAHIIATYNQTKEHTIDNDYTTGTAGHKTMQTAWYHYDSPTWFAGSFLFMNIGTEGSEQGTHKVRWMQTIGTHLTAKASGIDANIAGYYQFGHNQANQQVNAFMVSGNVKYQICPQLSVGVGNDYLSGATDNTASDECNTFDVLYGTHHKFYGTMDYFNGTKLRSRGLNDLNATVTYKPCDKVDLGLTYHYFATPAGVKVMEKDEVVKQKTLGSELDLQINWRVYKYVTLQAGYSIMGATQALENLQGSGNHNSYQDWGWVSININPRIFSTSGTSKKAH